MAPQPQLLGGDHARPRPDAAPPAYSERLAPGRYRATEHTGGAWSVTEQHTSPLSGLLVHAMDRFVTERAIGGRLVTARTTFDILGVVPTDEVDVHVEVVRPGRTIELLEAVAVSGGRAVLRAPGPGRATVWLATPVAPVADEPVGELARSVGSVDTANGIAVRRSPRKWMSPNVDLTTHLHRQPAGRWVGLDTTVVFGPDGSA